MFEQSVLVDHATGKRTGALAASATVQTLAVGVLLAIPLIYNERLPQLQPFIPLSAPLFPKPLPVHQPAAKMGSTHPTIFKSHVFIAPTRIPQTLDLSPTTIAGDDPGVSLDTGAAIGVPTLLPSFAPAISAAPPVRIIEPTVTKPPAKPLPVGGDVQAAKLLHKEIPIYPALARQARVAGTVRLIGIIAKDGTIQRLQVVSGHPLLTQAALDAVRRWVYRPTLLNGDAVEVTAPIDVIFTLSQ